MKLYAVVIGRKGKHTRYVCFAPFIECNLPADSCPLAVYVSMKRAKEAKQEIMRTCGHTDVYIIGFYTKP